MYIYRVLTKIGRLQWGVYGLGPKMGPLADLMSPVILAQTFRTTDVNP